MSDQIPANVLEENSRQMDQHKRIRGGRGDALYKSTVDIDIDIDIRKGSSSVR